MGHHNPKLEAMDATSENKRAKKKRVPSDPDLASAGNHVASGKQDNLVEVIFFALCCFCWSWIKALTKHCGSKIVRIFHLCRHSDWTIRGALGPVKRLGMPLKICQL